MTSVSSIIISIITIMVSIIIIVVSVGVVVIGIVIIIICIINIIIVSIIAIISILIMNNIIIATTVTIMLVLLVLLLLLVASLLLFVLLLLLLLFEVFKQERVLLQMGPHNKRRARCPEVGPLPCCWGSPGGLLLLTSEGQVNQTLQNDASEAHPGHIWSQAAQMLQMTPLSSIPAISEPIYPMCTNTS